MESYAHADFNGVGITVGLSRGTGSQVTRYDRFCIAYAELLGIMVRSVLASLCADSSAALARDGMTHKAKAQLLRDCRRLLTYAILKTCCTSDFPPEMASIVVSNAVVSAGSCYSRGPTLSTSTNTMQELHTLRTLHNFICCKQEILAGDALWGVWGGGCGGTNGRATVAYAGPPLPMPHARRTEATYSTHAKDCISNTAKVVEDIRHNSSLGAEDLITANDVDSGSSGVGGKKDPSKGWAGAARTPQEEFALQCRWARGEALFVTGVWNLGSSLGGSIAGALEIMQYSDDLTSASVAIDIGVVATSILVGALRSAPDASSPTALSSDSLATVLFRESIMPIWPLVLTVMGRHGSCLTAASSSSQSSSLFLKSLWRLFAEISRSGREFCEWMCSRGLLEIGISILGQRISHFTDASFPASSSQKENVQGGEWYLDINGSESSSFDGLSWMLRCVRCAATYFIDTDQIVNMLSTLWMLCLQHCERQSEVASQKCTVSWLHATLGEEGVSELFILLEELAVSCSLEIRARQYEIKRSLLPKGDYRSCEALCRIILDIAVAAVNYVTTTEVVDRAINKFDVACLQFIASVLGSNISELSIRTPMSVALMGSYLRGPGLCHELEFSIHNEAASVSSDSFISQIDSVRALFADMFSTKSCFWNNRPFSVHSQSAIFDSYELCLQEAYCLSRRRLLLCGLTIGTQLEVSAAAAIIEEVARLIAAFEFESVNLMVSSVAAGLFANEIRRITQHSIYVNLQLDCVLLMSQESMGLLQNNDDEKLLGYVSEWLPHILDFVPITARLLLEVVIRSYVNKDEPEKVHFTWDRNMTHITFIEDVDVTGQHRKEASADSAVIRSVLNAILQQTDGSCSASSSQYVRTGHLHIDNCVGTDTTHSGDSVSPFRKSLQDTLELHNHSAVISSTTTPASPVALVQHWMYDCLKALRGRFVMRWVQVLAARVIASSKDASCVVWGGISYGQLMFWMCRLVVSDLTYNSPHVESPDVLQIDGDPLSFCVDEYSSIMSVAVAGLYNATKCGADLTMSQSWSDFVELAETCVDISQTFAASAPSLTSADDGVSSVPTRSKILHLRPWEPKNLGVSSIHGAGSNAEGALDVVGRLLDGVCNQTCSEGRVHAVSLAPLMVAGLFPISLTKKVWRDIGGSQLRLLHLVENRDMFESLLPAFLPCAKRGSTVLSVSGEDLVLAIMDALLGLRNYSEERNLMIAKIGTYTIARFIFADDVDANRSVGVVSTVRGRLLRRLVAKAIEGMAICSKDDDSWKNCTLLSDVLQFYSVLAETEKILVRKEASSNLSESAITNDADRILTLWKNKGLFEDGDAEKGYVGGELEQVLQMQVANASMKSSGKSGVAPCQEPLITITELITQAVAAYTV